MSISIASLRTESSSRRKYKHGQRRLAIFSQRIRLLSSLQLFQSLIKVFRIRIVRHSSMIKSNLCNKVTTFEMSNSEIEHPVRQKTLKTIPHPAENALPPPSGISYHKKTIAIVPSPTYSRLIVVYIEY